jgi:hypothetical protein
LRRTPGFAPLSLLVLLTAPVGSGIGRAAVISVNCESTTVDTSRFNSAISNSKTGDSAQIRGTCLVDRTIVLFGNRSYSGDSRTGTVIRQANGTNLAAVLASDSWNSNAAGTGGAISIAHMTVDDHWCPVRSQIESVGYRHRADCSRSPMLEAPVKWAFSQLWSRSTPMGSAA